MTVWPNGSTTIPRVSDEFGMRTNPVDGGYRLHAGIDLVGWAINKSPVNGVVIFASYNGGAGNMITIRGDNGDEFIIMHNARFLVSVGQRVTEGQDVGVMGTTGNSTGVHCHFECHPGGGAAVNPRGYMAAAIGSSGSNATQTTQEGEEEMAKLVLVEIPLDPKTGAQIGDGNPATNQKHVFCVNPENHSFWHVVNTDQLKAYRAIGIPFYESQGNGWILEFRLLENGESA